MIISLGAVYIYDSYKYNSICDKKKTNYLVFVKH